MAGEQASVCSCCLNWKMSIYKNFIADQDLLRSIVNVHQEMDNVEYYRLVSQLRVPIKQDTLFGRCLSEVMKLERSGDIQAGQLPPLIESIIMYEDDKERYFEELCKEVEKMARVSH